MCRLCWVLALVGADWIGGGGQCSAEGALTLAQIATLCSCQWQ